MNRFYLDYGELFSAGPLPAGDLRVERVSAGSVTVVELGQ